MRSELEAQGVELRAFLYSRLIRSNNSFAGRFFSIINSADDLWPPNHNEFNYNHYLERRTSRRSILRACSSGRLRMGDGRDAWRLSTASRAASASLETPQLLQKFAARTINMNRYHATSFYCFSFFISDRNCNMKNNTVKIQHYLKCHPMLKVLPNNTRSG